MQLPRVIREPVTRFYGDRGPHLAAMIAYFALVSFFPLVFVSLALTSIGGRPDETSFLVDTLKHMFPDSSIDSLVAVAAELYRNATTLGVIGGLVLAWSALGLFSVLESAFNIVYGRPNRRFLHGKLVSFLIMAGLFLVAWAGLLLSSLGVSLLQRRTGIGDVVAVAAPIIGSLVAIFGFLVAAYRLLTNEKLSTREVLPGALLATVVLEATFQILPVYLRLSNMPALKALGGTMILLVWLYVMANVIVFGAEVNLTLSRRERPPAR